MAEIIPELYENRFPTTSMSFDVSSWSPQLPQGFPVVHFYCLDEKFQPDKSEWVQVGIIVNTSPLNF